MPGIWPSRASSRKQMRHRLNVRIKPRGRPHLKQRRTVRLENFGVLFAFAMSDFFAIKLEEFYPERSRGVAQKEEPEVLHSYLAAKVMALPCVTLFLRYPSAPGSLKNKAPNEARSIYITHSTKSAYCPFLPPVIYYSPETGEPPMRVMSRQTSELFDKLNFLANGDTELVDKAIRASQKVELTTYRYRFLWLQKGTYLKPTSDLTEIIRYIVQHRPSPKKNCCA